MRATQNVLIYGKLRGSLHHGFGGVAFEQLEANHPRVVDRLVQPREDAVHADLGVQGEVHGQKIRRVARTDHAPRLEPDRDLPDLGDDELVKVEATLMTALLDHEDVTVIKVGQVLPQLGLAHNQLLSFSSDSFSDEDPVAQSHWVAESDCAKVDVLQEAESLHLGLHIEADIPYEGHGPGAQVVSAHKQILFLLLLLIHQQVLDTGACRRPIVELTPLHHGVPPIRPRLSFSLKEGSGQCHWSD